MTIKVEDALTQALIEILDECGDERQVAAKAEGVSTTAIVELLRKPDATFPMQRIDAIIRAVQVSPLAFMQVAAQRLRVVA